MLVTSTCICFTTVFGTPLHFVALLKLGFVVRRYHPSNSIFITGTIDTAFVFLWCIQELFTWKSEAYTFRNYSRYVLELYAARHCSGKQSSNLSLCDSCLLEIELFWVNFTIASDNTFLFINAHTAAWDKEPVYTAISKLKIYWWIVSELCRKHQVLDLSNLGSDADE